MARSSHALSHYRLRYARRLVPENLPDDLQDTGTWVVRVLRSPAIEQQLGADRTRHAGKPAPDRPARFQYPAMPHQSRQTSADGQRTFHVGWSNPDRFASAAESDDYASSKAACAERSEPDELEAANDDYNPRAAIAETYAAGHAGADGPSRLTISNLRPDLADRQPQWHEIEAVTSTIGLKRKTEYERGEDRINIKFACGPALAAGIAAHPDCPTLLRDAIVAEQERRADGRALNDRRERVGAPLRARDAAAMHHWIRSTEVWKAASAAERKAFSLSRGRTRRAYDFLDFELPTDLGQPAQVAVLRGVVRFIAEQPGDPRRAVPGAQVPVSGSIHHPDGLNDARNAHVHIVHGLHRGLVNGDGALVRRNGQPVFEQTMAPAFTSRDWKMQLRTEIARLCNVELAEVGAPYRLHPGTDREIGNDGAPMRKLYAGATVEARAGVPSPLRLENAAEGWRRRFEAIDRERLLGLRLAKRRARQLRNRIRNEAPEALQLEIAGLPRDLLEQEAIALAARRERQVVQTLIEMTRSSAAEVARFAPEYAKAAMRGGRPSYDSATWMRRAGEASQHLDALDRELMDEREGVEERRRIERDASTAADRIAATIVAELDRARLAPANDPPTPVLENQATVSSPLSQAAPRRHALSPHRAVEAIDTHAVRISVDGDRLFIAPEDDPDKLVAGVDFTPVESRLQGLRRKQDGELAIIAPYLRAHGRGGLADDRLAALTGRLPDMIRKWTGTRTFATLLEEVEQNRRVADPLPEPADTALAQHQATPEEQTASTSVVKLQRGEVEAALRHQAEESIARADRAMAALLRQKLWGGSGPTALTREFLIDLYAHPEYYAANRDDELVCTQRGDRAAAFGLLMGDPALAQHAVRAHAAATNGERLPFARWLGVDERLPAHHRSGAGWIRAALDDERRLRDHLPTLLASRPRLTSDPSGLIGVRDEQLVTAAGTDALGLHGPRAQSILRAAWLIQREEEQDCLGLIATGEIQTALKRDKGSGQLRLTAREPGALPGMFDPFAGDPAFIARALAAGRPVSPERRRRHLLLRAWDAAANEVSAVRRELAALLLARDGAAQLIRSLDGQALTAMLKLTGHARAGQGRRRGVPHHAAAIEPSRRQQRREPGAPDLPSGASK